MAAGMMGLPLWLPVVWVFSWLTYTFPCLLRFRESSGLVTISITVLQQILQVEVEDSVGLAGTAIKVEVDIDPLAVSPGEESLHVVNSHAQLSSLHPVGGILVLETNVDTEHVEGPVQLAGNRLPPDSVQSSTMTRRRQGQDSQEPRSQHV